MHIASISNPIGVINSFIQVIIVSFCSICTLKLFAYDLKNRINYLVKVFYFCWLARDRQFKGEIFGFLKLEGNGVVELFGGYMGLFF